MVVKHSTCNTKTPPESKKYIPSEVTRHESNGCWERVDLMKWDKPSLFEKRRTTSKCKKCRFCEVAHWDGGGWEMHEEYIHGKNFGCQKMYQERGGAREKEMRDTINFFSKMERKGQQQ